MWQDLSLVLILQVWGLELALLLIPGLAVGAGISWMADRWYPCLILSYTATVGLVILAVYQGLQHHTVPVGPIELGLLSLINLPPVLVVVSLGYFIGKRIKATRRMSATSLRL